MLNSVSVLYCTLCLVRFLNLNLKVVNLMSFIEHVDNTLSLVHDSCFSFYIGYYNLSGFCCVCHVFSPLVSIFGLFPVLV